ncbi:MAG: decaprenyl-phosphate phosphoribosyltransferase [Candidatus Lernaella stagnicola]|nr:decaprenyl-phosphate phosphoribosyltransferase [Candidatus Lernaella stagnicola]
MPEVGNLMPWRLLFTSMRPRHFMKNILVFAPLVFAQRFTEFEPLYHSLLAFGIFCGLSGAGYLVNDVVDREGDRLHKKKALRPVAAGLLLTGTAVGAAAALYAASLALAFMVGKGFGYVALSYVIVSLAYSLILKNIVIVDLFAVAAGYVLRVVAGAVVIPVAASSWLLICAMLLSLFIALSKRTLEIRLLQGDAVGHRRTLAEYNPYLLGQMTAVITSALLVAYTLYTRSPGTLEKFHTGDLVYSVPFVLYGIFRYLYLLHVKEGYHTLERVLITDKPMLVNMMLYVLVVGYVLY